jgi:hypothetical protein
MGVEMRRQMAGALILVLATALGVGCAGVKQQPQAMTRTVTAEQPVLAPAPGYSYTKTIDGVEITLAPTAFEERRLVRRDLEQKAQLVTFGGVKRWIVTELPLIRYEPSTITLGLKVTNRLDHVLRFGGTVVRFDVDGKPEDATGIETLQKAVLIPNQSWEGEIQGPAWESLGSPTNLVFSIFDVVTAVDAANNPTKRTNFEWILSFEKKPLSVTMEARAYEKDMTEADAANFKGIWPAEAQTAASAP